MRQWTPVVYLTALIAVGVPSAAALAFDKTSTSPPSVMQELAGSMTDDVERGWDYLLRLGSTLTLGSSQNVIGTDDGRTLNFGLQLKGSLSYRTGPHEWRSLLGLYETVGVTPNIQGLQKSVDRFQIETFYFFRYPRLSWTGLYARAHLGTSLLAGWNRNDSLQDYTIEYIDGNTESVSVDSLQLTDPFKPLVLSQGAGLTAEAAVSDAFLLECLLGWGALQVIAENQFAIVDDPDSGPTVVRQLESFWQTGPESLVAASGGLDGGKVTYSLHAGALLPVVFSETTTSSGGASSFDLMFLRAGAAVTFHIWDWLSIDYHFSAVRNPQLVDAFQLTSSLLFSINVTLLDGGDSSPAEPAAPDGSGGGSSEGPPASDSAASGAGGGAAPL